MSPHDALHSRIFLTYLVVVAVLPALAALAITVLQRRLNKPLVSIWITYRSWLIMIPIVAVAVFLGRWTVIAAVALLSIFAFKEFARATGLYRDWWMTGAVYLSILALAAASAMDDRFAPHQHGWFGLFMAMPVFAINLLVIIPVIRNQAHGQLQTIALSILGFLYIGWMFGTLGFLADSNNPYGYILFLVLATELNDVAAFTFGRFFGRRAPRSNISPGKTWGGAIGAALFSMLVPWALWFSLPRFGPKQLLLTGLIVGVGGQLGDMAISVFKRDIGVKDMGATIPGHGGILDRIDSLIFVAPLFTHMVHYYIGLR